MSFEIIYVLLCLAGMVATLISDRMRPGMVLFSVVVLFLCAGILTPKECLEGFSNKGMITVALLFLVSEGIRKSGVLEQLIFGLLPKQKCTVEGGNLRVLPVIAAISAFLNNTPVVVIFAPMIKNWARKMKLPPTKFLIPISYATIMGGMCTLIGTSTNLVVDGMVQEAGYRGFTIFELGKVGIFIAVVGIAYLVFFSKKLLPDNSAKDDDIEDAEGAESGVRVEAVLSSRFPGNGKTLRRFDFYRHYGANVRSLHRNGKRLTGNWMEVPLCENDTLVLETDGTFIPTWGDSRVFLMLSVMDAEPEMGRRKRYFAMVLLLMMIIGATVGELPFVEAAVPGMKLDMFFFVCVTTVIMAWTGMFSPKKYTKFISWDVLITIACAFAISRGMSNSGFAGVIADYIIGMTDSLGPYALLAVIYVITNLFTELITNNAAAALSFPIALAVAEKLGVDPTPFFVVICMAASAAFSTPIGYQTNLIVQGVGGYKFTDFVKVGLPLNLIVFLLSVFLIPLFWAF
ncbi:MAG: SLC13/DASS family transporter [Prevotella sp.]|nr:SLC13/DASS family transporter [Prevotella sp.]